MRAKNASGEGRNLTWMLWTAAGCALAAVVAGAATAGMGMPQIPNSHITVTAPDEFVVTNSQGEELTLHRSPLRADTLAAGVDRIVSIDATPNQSDTITLMSHQYPRVTDPLQSQTRLVIDDGGRPVEVGDLVQTYFADAEHVTVLPTEVDGAGDLIAAIPSSAVELRASDAAVTALYPGWKMTYRLRDGSEMAVQTWDVVFDFTVAHAQGRTNLAMPLEWYTSPVAHAIEAAAPWVLGVTAVGTVVLVIGYVRRRRT